MKKNIIKKLTCIECPKGCPLKVSLKNNRVIGVSGNQCEKGEAYAYSEIENPSRILTSSVLGIGLGLKMIPVRTDKPIPKTKTLNAMREIKKIRIKKPVKTGDVIVDNFMGLDVRLVASRGAFLLH